MAKIPPLSSRFNPAEDSLPLEMWLNIFSFLPFAERMNMTRVNKNFKKFVEDMVIDTLMVIYKNCLAVIAYPFDLSTDRLSPIRYSDLLSNMQRQDKETITNIKNQLLSSMQIPTIEEVEKSSEIFRFIAHLRKDSLAFFALTFFAIGLSAALVSLILISPLGLIMIASAIVTSLLLISSTSLGVYLAVQYGKLIDEATDKAIKIKNDKQHIVGFFDRILPTEAIPQNINTLPAAPLATPN